MLSGALVSKNSFYFYEGKFARSFTKIQSRVSLAFSYLIGLFGLIDIAVDGLQDIKYSVSNYRMLPFSLELSDLSTVVFRNQDFSRVLVALLIFFASSTIIIKMIFLG